MSVFNQPEINMNLALDDDFGFSSDEEYEAFMGTLCVPDESDRWTKEEIAESEEFYDRFLRACLSADVFEHSFEDIRVGTVWYPYDDAPF